MNGPWEAFSAAATRAERAGYFERAPDADGRGGYAVWFDRAELLPAVRTAGDLATTRTAVDRHLGTGGRRLAAGYLGFEAFDLFEPDLGPAPGSGPFPRGEFLLANEVHTGSPARRRGPRRRTAGSGVGRPRVDSLPRASFRRSVARLRRDIRKGEAFQVVLAHRREWARPSDLLARAGRLRSSEQFAYFYYLRTGDREVVGASPESVVEVRRSLASINPIAGTRPRPSGAERLPLRRDPKELAEHRMLVDLARNDLGRVAAPGSVRVAERERRVRFARLEHLVSRVTARLRPGHGSWDALAATFPAGTVSGAPKLRATELLRREERTWRGPYGGAVGLLRPGGRADWALLIRSAFAARGTLCTAAGAGIVHRSDPDREYDETLTKLSALEGALVGGDGP